MGHFYEVEMEFTPEQLDFINHLVDTTTATFNDVVVFLIKLGLDDELNRTKVAIQAFEWEYDKCACNNAEHNEYNFECPLNDDIPYMGDEE